MPAHLATTGLAGPLAVCSVAGRRQRAHRLLVPLLACALLVAPLRAAADDPAGLRIAVASNFRAAAQDLADTFSAHTGIPVSISSAASGVLATQILRGAPFDLFLAADSARPQAIHAAGRSTGPPVCYARGGLVLLGADDLMAALADADRSLAIANPRSAPYGRAAMAVLERAGIAGSGSRRVLRGANVQQALQFFDSGAADLALVARSLAGDRGLPIPSAWHPPIDQYAVVIIGGEREDAAQAFLEELLAGDARQRLNARGYEVCP